MNGSTSSPLADGNRRFPVSAKLSIIAAAILAAAGLAGCNTVSGAGQDVASVGNAVSRGANQTSEAVFGGGSSSEQQQPPPQQAQVPPPPEQPGVTNYWGYGTRPTQ